MVQALEQAAEQSADPFDGPMPQLLVEVHTGRRGRPRKQINAAFLQEGLTHRGTSYMGRLLQCSSRTVRRRALEEGIVNPATPVLQVHQDPDGSVVETWTSTGPLMSTLNHDPARLDEHVSAIHERHPRFGQGMMRGALQGSGHRVTMSAVVSSMHRMLGPSAPFGHQRIQRRVYNVVAANSLWHHDGHHGM